jgi:carbon monoxide dehydrogenase subunit G
MKALKIIGIVILSLIVIIVIMISVLSPKSHIERSIVINASPAAVYPEISNFKSLNVWSPWAALDPNTQYTFEGPEYGAGAKMNWTSTSDKVGTGSQWIIEANENHSVKSGMQFGGFEGNFTAELILEPVNEGTKVTWTYDGDVSNTGLMNNAFGKIFGSFTDKMLGPQYEQGLASLKSVVERKPVEQPASNEIPADSVVAKP